MSFETTERTMAMAPELVGELFARFYAAYGEDLPDGQKIVRCFAARWDDSGHTRIRAASLENETPQQLTDGRVAYSPLWQTDLAAEFDAHGLAGVEELTPEQLAALTPVPEVIP